MRGPVKSSFPASARSSLNLPSQGSNDLRAVGSPPAFATPKTYPVKKRTVRV